MKQRIEGTRLLGVAWVAVLIVLLILSWTNVLESTRFYGIADTREIVINAKNPVEIKDIHVVEGESVIHGQLMVELRNPEMTLKINQISHQLDQLKAQKDVDKTELKSKIAQLKAQKNARISETDHRIQELENVLSINSSLTSGLKSVTGDDLDQTGKNSHPIVLKIERLKQELASAVNLLDIQIDLQNQALDAADKPVGIQINQLEKELTMLKRENSKLDIYSTISGVIGSVNYKIGEKVSPFAPIITLNTKTPSIIKGYIRENEYSRVSIGDTLSISSLADVRNEVTGSVVGVGARIVEYPVRLRKHPDLLAWGREITVKIPQANQFLLGEKVQISMEKKNKSLLGHLKSAVFPNETIAGTSTLDESLFLSSPSKSGSAILPVTPLTNASLEASAMLYLPDLDQYLLASDETPHKKLLLYLMDRSGQITKEIPIAGVDAIDDIESMTSDDKGTIYIAASMSAKKNGGTPLSRRLLLTIKRDDGFYLDQQIDLLLALKECAELNSDEQWAKFILDGISEKETDVEGIFWYDNALFLGFKSPSFMARSIILKIARADQLIERNQLNGKHVSIWKMLKLGVGELSVQESISDLFYRNGSLFITGVPESNSKGDRSGSLWRLNLYDDSLTRIVHFKDLKPEGIAAAAGNDSLLICFDQGRRYQSQITLVKGV